MAIQPVKEFFAKHGMEDRIQEFSVSSATVALAAQALGCEEQRIAKSLAFWVEDKPILVVAAGDAKVQNGKYKAFFGTKATMISFDDVEDAIGHAVGGVCPFAIRDGVTVYLDESLKRFETVFPACGSANSAICLTLEELENLSGAKAWVDVCKIPEEA